MMPWPELARPQLLWLLLLLVPYAWLRWRTERRDRVPHAPLQLEAPADRGAGWRWLWLPAELVLLGLVLVAVAGPFHTTELQLLEDEGIDVVLVLDISLSMLAEDIEPNRIEALRQVARELIERSGGNRLGIVGFAKDSYVHSPLTTDHHTLLRLLDSLTVYVMSASKSAGTAIGDALLVASDRLQKARRQGRDQVVVLISDGESNEGIEPTLAARHLAAAGVRLYVIGLGGEEPVEVMFEGRRLGRPDDPYLAYLDDQQLREIASAGDGRYFRAVDRGTLAQIFTELAQLETAPLEPRQVAVRRSLAGRWAPSALALWCGVLWLGGVALRRPWR